jgi:hypothetical protein
MRTWSAAAIVAVATTTVAIANVAFLWVNAWATRRHEWRMERMTRTQARLGDTYSDFVTMMHRVTTWADATEANLPPQLVPDRIPERDVYDAVGRLRTFASDSVINAADRWSELFALPLLGDVGRQGVADLRAQERVVRELIRRELNA